MGQYNFVQDLEMLEKEKMIVITRTSNVMTAFKMSDLAVDDETTRNYVTDILMRTPQGALLLLETGSKKMEHKKQTPSFKEYCKEVLGKDYEKVMSNPLPLSYDGQVSITKLYAQYRKLIGKPFSSNVTDKNGT